ncbi:demethylmenaquinone methyltransferase-like [Patiria miniata]|uniref:Methyltransferase type 11 domain-containing protein n=1 Tax=Patiria miniata TaxID=46514 RepID=A0A914B7X2_PATMI|nr:demethylmenaquinone methyltransferase-like [Patiria miniata]
MAEVDLQRILTEIEKRRVRCRKQESAAPEESLQMMRDMYAEWINNDYDKDMEVLGFKSPFELAETISLFISDKNSRVLDCASGTGLLGLELKKRGYIRIDALDASKESLDYSRGKQVYTNYFCEYLGHNRLPIENGTYDAICMSAAFGNTHVRPDCFSELLRITKPGGYVIFNVRAENLILDECCKSGKLDDVIHKMAAKGKVEFLEKKRHVYMQCEQNGNTEYCYAFVLRVIGNK